MASRQAAKCDNGFLENVDAVECKFAMVFSQEMNDDGNEYDFSTIYS
jgi:hypothetical protein